MNLPFTAEDFFSVFRSYNLAVWPFQVFLYLLAITVIYLGARRWKLGDRIIFSILAFFWIWMGVAYHLMHFTKVNNAAWIFGIAFIIQGLLFLYEGFFHRQISIKYQENIYGITGAIFIFYALMVYPLAGFWIGHQFPDAPGFGLPCPTTIFTFGILLWSDRRPGIIMLAIPLVWSVIGFMAAIAFGMYEDIFLLFAGLLTLLLLVILPKKPNGIVQTK